MRSSFLGHYQPSEEEFSQIWNYCLFVLDANVLLNLYRYSSLTRDLWINVISSISNRLWIPHQAGLEYQENRLEVIHDQVRVYDQISNLLQRTHEDLEALLRRGHLSIDATKLMDTIDRTSDAIRKELDDQRARHPDLQSSDTIREEITGILEGKVGPPYDQRKLSEIYSLGAARYGNDVPPGYKDRDKKGVSRYGSLAVEKKYGDLVLWFQVLDKAKIDRRPILFVTDDTKEDWWWESKGRVVGPRPELVTEMKQTADVAFYMYPPHRFIERVGEYLHRQVDSAVISEVRELAETKSWKEEVLNALRALGGQADLTSIYEYIERTTTRELPRSWQPIIRATLQFYSSGSAAYRGTEDLFQPLGEGYWAVRTTPLGLGATRQVSEDSG